MRKLFLFLVLVSYQQATFGKYLRLDYMDPKTAEQKWGKQTFDSGKFKSGDYKVRASMAVDLIQSKRYIGKTFQDVRKELGTWDGYFVNDVIPAYFIDTRKAGEKKDSWVVVFLPDKSGKKVEEVKIQKNCCYSAEEYGTK